MSILGQLYPYNQDNFSSDNDWDVLSGPVSTIINVLPTPFPDNVIQEHNIVPTKEWIISRQDVCFKISISDYYAEKFSYVGFDIEIAMQLVSKLEWSASIPSLPSSSLCIATNSQAA